MFSLRRNRAFLVKILLLTPLTWLCVVLYMNSSTKIIQQQQQGHQEQIVYVNDNKIQVEDSRVPQEQIAVKGPPLKDNLLRKKKPTPSGGDRGDAGDSADHMAGQGVLMPPHEPDGPGEMGKAVVLPKEMTPEQKKLVDDGWQKNAFNQYVSDMISVHRTLPDPRDDRCKEPGRYLTTLPATDVIVCFHNEAWSVLLRTVHSILDRSPAHLLKEIILVDDFSDMEHVKAPLENYMAQYPKVKIVRLPKREGLIRARLLGLEHATAPVVTYLDSHCECTEGWLEPLLDRIARNSTTVVCPVIDVIDEDSLAIHFDKKSVQVGGFDWGLQFNWHAIPEHEKKRRQHTADPAYSPTMAGGLFSIDREFFKKLGTYDDGFDIWGGENLELSFKTWMCGGTLEIIPCSHVGHIFRKRSPYKWRTGVNVLKRNNVRLAEVWLDEYSEYYYQRIGHDRGDYGDVSSRKRLREELGCKSFKWYLDNIFPELFIPGDAVASGEVRNLGFSPAYCLDGAARKANLHKPIGLWPCHGQSGNQFWLYSKTGEIRRDEACLDYAGSDVILYPCHGAKGNQYWEYDPETNFVQHGSSKNCLAISEDKKKITVEKCSEDNPRIKWKFEKFEATKKLQL
ncbi:putative polypeptide N-acetylgalactosaminyltransferase 9 isoform X1 [Daphnia magna]|uniref:putative polypeptide N-acetylgalactosaminyltransferase 9 isoform X1 n=1 Tax=Daphnia magna TaxID=35525 RepID=UPI001E1BD365|nr:putative polypeptide N-acetylgalactosaminyltransferase 9 isoform X1 [Daphnia magna]XP_032785997.2 putative polypeptide N-acetylgalactosaminyltransferase 9 isoform X1 [Daphnia magna]XP_032785998.2 putative polypeptide N-acetylgalactosaminyltransferase 9 isoform X1 [Daphnia magna]XP_032785999.2 putative polypeptide N-acetylgalactosaminyltransferase 9 isoform X1 [Daphnia magna]XP_032786000.2 putative polypeptide N-acetylgalactosaminyltransferase 9 isoform X1 [Daphnia magna]